MKVVTRASVERMETDDIRNVQTPLSLGGLHLPARTLWKRSTFHPKYTTSTPICDDRSVDNSSKSRHLRVELDYSNNNNSYLEPNVSPIFRLQPAIAIFGRKNSIDSDRLSTTGVAATLGKMELCDNNYDNNNEEPQNYRKEKIKGEGTGESSSSFHAHEQFKKHINKIKKRKSNSPKNKSPKVYKIGPCKKLVGASGVSKKLNSSKHKVSTEKTKKLVKSPKSKSPKSQKIVSSKKVIGSSTATTIKKRTSPSKQKITSGSSDKISVKKEGSTCPTLKLSRCPKSPRLHTAARAAQKQHLEEIRKEKEKAMEALKIREEEERQRREKEEVLKLRQQTIFKAQPIRKYAPLPLVKKRALTDPITPNLSKKRRIEYSSQSNSNSNSNNQVE